MIRNKSFHNKNASSEIVGGLILIVIAVLAFSVIRVYLFPDLEPVDINIKLEGYVTDRGAAVVEHVGGEKISDYKVVVSNTNGALIGTKIYRDLIPEWSIGQCIYPLEDIGYPPLILKTDKVEVMIYIYNSEGEEQEVFRGILSGNLDEISDSPVLISSLKTNTPDEDLICYSYPIIPDINATTYIYNWKLNGNPIAELIMPFNTENNDTCKDYTGNIFDGTLVGPDWVKDGVVGGGYFFDGSSEYITMSLPSIFNDIPNNDFTLSIWLKCMDIEAENSIILMAAEDNSNFVELFIKDNQIHFGIVYDGVKDAVRTENLSSGLWYHIAAVWKSDEQKIFIYCNGELSTEAGYRNFAMGTGVGLLEIGHGSASSPFYCGYADEFEIYNRVISQEQNFQNYLSTKDGFYDRRVIVSKDTSIGDKWQCIVTPNDVVQDGTPVYSNIITIINYQGGD
ncbi:hypothetical protein AYK21_05145 [Thermoplasmatales archaeon SG8-52-2]|nr:MAG: hypothetical protein AYK21_05145 [Thermoplasmatales archaeon SG8-52-2]